METPLIRVKQLAYVRVEATDVASAEKFLQEFGLQVVERTNGQTYFRGTDAATPCYILSEGPGTVTTIAFEAEGDWRLQQEQLKRWKNWWEQNQQNYLSGEWYFYGQRL
mgnify:CR=1 FL=1